ncbi:hypothetical protein B0A55_10235 [Friedmanniomyces simplex]|uniref:Uncharacterized protein n=1 Tax=Friedmanniomyces simplex TaxID=329884 RepID=A0A4U0WKK1_9PEZI|nr:hypothetical protein B0A55_10235 [Friedmanniomyces simplex]
MDASPFGRIPAELRNEIFRLALTSNTPIALRPDTEPALLRTSRQIRGETRGVFWAGKDFVVNVATDTGVQTAQDIGGLDQDKLRLIPKIIVRSKLVLQSRGTWGTTPVDDLELVVDALAARGATKQQVEMVVEFAENIPAHIRGLPRAEAKLEERKRWCLWLWECAVENATK